MKTAQSRISELESQLRTAELQLKQLKDTKSSAASFTENIASNQSGISGVGLTSSQYSSSSESSSKYVSGTGSTTSYQTPSYGGGITTETSNLSSSGVRQGYSSSYGTSGVTGSTSYGTTGVTGATSYGTSGLTGTTSYGTTGVTGTTSYGTTGLTGTTTYGTTGITGTTGTTYGKITTYGSGLSGSGVGGSTSGYSYQTKKYWFIQEGCHLWLLII